MLSDSICTLKVLLHLLVFCKFSISLGDVSPPMTQDGFLQSLNKYEIIIPSRVTQDGSHITYSLHPAHSLRRRSVDDSASDSNVLHYRISIENKIHILQLTPNNNLLSPGFVIERKKNRFKNVTDSTFTRLHKSLGNCHFHGNVLNQTITKAALGLCDGMHGFVHTDAGEYFIEPIKDEHLSTEGQRRHVVYRRSALPIALDPIQSSLHRRKREQGHDGSCGVNDFENKHEQRERWESHNRQRRQFASGRRKRSFSTERFVETLVVVDHSMIKYHKNEHLETYVLTIMNMVSAMFHDASIGNSINIVLVRILLMDEEQEELSISHHADKTLQSFCKFQKAINFQDDDHPNHHDVAVLLTRKNICSRINEPCGTLGLAQVAGICQPHRSCSINEDTGLALAYTVTHELGHNFGMYHDGAGNGCEDPPGKQLFIMSPSLVADSLSKSWSNCSKESVTMFIDRGWGYCLDDEPTSHQFNFPVLPPGIMYNADHQCRLQYGTDDAAICIDEQDVCSNLWCRIDNRCSTHLEAAAEGTICGRNMWCYQGDCVKIGERAEAINGEWGEWTVWSECTRTCDGGVSHSQRHCDNPAPSNSGKYCLGERKRYRICNTESCTDEAGSFTQVQCEEFNNIPYKNNIFEWEHVPTPETPCQLHCKPKNQFFSVLMKDTVTDGTPCTPSTRNMCITGRCRHIGCDYGIDSKAREDRCGVCHGDGSTCTTIKSQFNESQRLGYVEAAIIPAGARNIRVEEVAAANNFIALQSANGEYILNGQWFIQWSGEYKGAGTIIQYQRDGNKESVLAAGPLKEPIHVLLLLQSSNQGIVFEYTLPKDNITEPRLPEFHWVFEHWTHCTASCGGGSQRSEVVCMELEAGVVDDGYCNITTKPDDKQRVCNEHLCPARWWTGPWQHCSVTCGNEGVHHRTVICVRSLGLDEQIALDDEACKSEDKPAEVEHCHKKETCPGNSSWIVGEWSSCNWNMCGLRYRSVRCNDTGIGCHLNPMPLSEMRCADAECSQWTVGEWGECTRTCGNGIQMRQVSCDGQYCDSQDEPQSQRICYLTSCSTAFFTVRVIHTTRNNESNKEILPNISEEPAINKKNKHVGELSERNDIVSEINEYDGSKQVATVTNKTVTEQKKSHVSESNNISKSFIPNDIQTPQSINTISVYNSSYGRFLEVNTNTMYANDIVTHTTVSTIGNVHLTNKFNLSTKETLFVIDQNSTPAISANTEVFHKHRHHHGGTTMSIGDVKSERQNHHQHSNFDIKLEESQRIGENKDNDFKAEKMDSSKDSNYKTLQQLNHKTPDAQHPTSNPSTHLAQNSFVNNKAGYQNVGKLSPLPDKSLFNNENIFKLPSLSDVDKLHIYNLPPLPENPGLVPLLPDKDNLAPLPNLEDLPPLPDMSKLPNKDFLVPLPLASTLAKKAAEYKDTGYETQANVLYDGKTSPPEVRLSLDSSDLDNHTQSLNNKTAHGPVDNGNIVDKLTDENSAIKYKSSDNKETQQNEETLDLFIDNHGAMFVSPEYPKESIKSRLDTPTQGTHTKYTWVPLNWTECSRYCGGGVKIRVVTCVEVAINEVSKDFLCDINTKPTAIEECNPHKCLPWITQEWQECSASCGDGSQKRTVTCPAVNSCAPEEKPIIEISCDLPECVHWVSGPWSKCTKSCDGGEQIRLIQCINTTSQLPSHGCDVAIRPAEHRACNTDPCTQNNAALSIRCEHNEMSSTACHALRKMGQCLKRFVSLKCCKTCSKDLYNKPNKDRPKYKDSR